MAENHHSGRNQPPVEISRGAAAVLLILLVCGFYWKLLLTNQFTWLAGGDTTSQVLPWLQHQAREWHAGRIPLWDPNQWYGQPLIGQAQPGVAYPLNWLLFAMPLRDGFIKTGWLNWYFVAIHLMAAWFAYLLARGFGVRRASAIYAGAAYSLLGWMGQTEWPQMLNGAVWAPLVLHFVFRACRGRATWSSAVFGGVFLGMSWLSGHHQAPIFLSLACGAVFLWNAAANRRLLAVAAVFFAAGLCSGAAQILPAYEYGKNAVRWVGVADPIGWGTKIPWTVHKEFQTRPGDLLGIVLPGMHTHASPYAGATTLTLAIAGFWLWRRRRETRWIAGAGAAALLFSMVETSPLHGILYSLLPLVEKARNPSAAVYLTSLTLAVLAALALDRLARDAALLKRVAKALVWFCAGTFAVRAGWALTHEYSALKEDRMLAVALCAVALALVLDSARRRKISPAAAAICATLLMVVEASNENGILMPAYLEKDRVAPLTAMSEHNDIAAFLRRQPGIPRAQVDDQLIRYNFGDWHGIHTSGGYLASLTTSVATPGLAAPGYQRMLGVGYAIGNQPTAIHTEDVFTGSSGLKVYRDPQARAPAFAVHEILPWLPGHNAIMMNDHFKDRLGTAAFITGEAPALETCPDVADQVEIEAYRSSEVRLRASMGCRGLIVLADAHFPGWNAYVDGVRTNLYEVDGGLRGAVAGPGKHEIVFRYEPRSVAAGVALTGLAWLLSAVLLGRNIMNRRRFSAGLDPPRPDASVNIVA